MARVYLAHDERYQRPVAIKVLKGVDDLNERQRVVAEAHNCARLSHPNIVAIYDAFEDKGVPIIVLEYVEGKTFRQLLDAGIQNDEALSIIGDTAQALYHAHVANVVHRDIKPENIIVTEDGKAKVTDWGLSRTLDDPTGLTRTGVIVGTPAYLAPERLQSKKVNKASDLYALGCMLFEVFNNKPPYGTEPIASVLQGHLSQKTPHLRSNSRELNEISTKLLDKEPQKRPSPNELVAVIDGYSSANDAAPFSHIETKHKKSWRRPFFALSTTLLILMTIFVSLTSEKNSHKPNRNITVSRESFKKELKKLVFGKQDKARGSRALLLSRRVTFEDLLSATDEISIELHYKQNNIINRKAARWSAERLAVLVDFVSTLPASNNDEYAPIFFRLLTMAEGLRQTDNRLIREALKETAAVAKRDLTGALKGALMRVDQEVGDVSCANILLNKLNRFFNSEHNSWTTTFLYRAISISMNLKLDNNRLGKKELDKLSKMDPAAAHLTETTFLYFLARLRADLLRATNNVNGLKVLAQHHWDNPPKIQWLTTLPNRRWLLWRDIMIRDIATALLLNKERKRAIKRCHQIFQKYGDNKYKALLLQFTADLLAPQQLNKVREDFRERYPIFHSLERPQTTN